MKTSIRLLEIVNPNQLRHTIMKMVENHGNKTISKFSPYHKCLVDPVLTVNVGPVVGEGVVLVVVEQFIHDVGKLILVAAREETVLKSCHDLKQARENAVQRIGNL